MSPDVRIGAPGWRQERFNTVEINNSFYQPPSENGLKHWRQSTPENFVFALKGSRFLTHMKRLKDPEPDVLNLLRARDAAYCAFHLSGYHSPVELTATFAYVRLHGAGGRCQGTYDRSAGHLLVF